MDTIDHIFLELTTADTGFSPLIACLYTGLTFPRASEPMSRIPMPSVGGLLDESLGDQLRYAISINSSIHDGAVMLGRTQSKAAYEIKGWSFRLFPGPLMRPQVPNKGSAFNSCLAMSQGAEVDRIYLVNDSYAYCFEGSGCRELSN